MRRIERNTQGRNVKVQVTFSMPGSSCGDSLYLVGWFDEWGESAYRMQLTAQGNWSLTLELEPGREYQYGYRTTDGRWLKDPDSAEGVKNSE